jgi:hypothetical protein
VVTVAVAPLNVIVLMALGAWLEAGHDRVDMDDDSQIEGDKP